MTGSQWFLLTCLATFVVRSRYLISRAFPRGRDSLAAGKGNAASAVLYSLTGAMLPWKKETARRHMLSYALGVGYHAGVILSFLVVILVFFDIQIPLAAARVSALLTALGAICGLALLIRRITRPEMRYFSSPDDYFSNLLVTGLLAITALAMIYESMTSWFFIYTGVVLLYIPFSKLRHAIYLGLARVYLGLFYGRRGVWPARGRKSWQA